MDVRRLSFGRAGLGLLGNVTTVNSVSLVQTSQKLMSQKVQDYLSPLRHKQPFPLKIRGWQETRSPCLEGTGGLCENLVWGYPNLRFSV